MVPRRLRARAHTAAVGDRRARDPALSFGDPLAARVEVLADPKQVDLGSLRVRPRFAPWRIVSETRERQSGAGTLLVYHWTLECLSQACLPGRTLAERRFLPALISYRISCAWRPDHYKTISISRRFNTNMLATISI